MTTERTLCIIKPDACEKRQQGIILQRLLDEGFELLGMKHLRLSLAQAQGFYAVHEQRPFFHDLCAFMTRGPVVVLALRRDNAVAHLRGSLVPRTRQRLNPEPFDVSMAPALAKNAVHGSDSAENGRIECSYFFAESDLR